MACASTSYRLSPVIKISSPATREFWELPVLYEDDYLLALSKPAALLTGPDPEYPERPSLLQLLHAGIAEGKPWARERGLTYIFNAHRLDTEVSGVLLFAKTKEILAQLANSFGSSVPRYYWLALVQGSPPEEQFATEAKLAPHPARPGEMHIDHKRGKRSRTLFKVLERFGRWTLLECELTTIRPHQVRSHLRYLKYPVAGDRLYGGQELRLSQLKSEYRLKPGRHERALTNRPALHAERLALPHPVTGNLVEVKASWPRDLGVIVKYLRRYSPTVAGGAEVTAPGDSEAELH